MFLQQQNRTQGIFMSSIGGPGGPKKPTNTDRPDAPSREIKVKRQTKPAIESKTPPSEPHKTGQAEALFSNITAGKLEIASTDTQNHALNTQDLITEVEKFGFPLAGALKGSPRTTAKALNMSTTKGNNAFQSGVLNAISGPKPAGLIGAPRTVRIQ